MCLSQWAVAKESPLPRRLLVPLFSAHSHTFMSFTRFRARRQTCDVCAFPPDSIEGEYVPMEGDEVTYKVCPIPPKNQKIQAVDVVITHLNPVTKHETWSGQIISS